MNTVLLNTTGQDALTDSTVRLRQGNAKSARPAAGSIESKAAGWRRRLSARKHKHATFAVYDGRNRRSVAWAPFRAGTPDLASRRFVESDHGRPVGCADVDDQELAFHERS